ncbi:MAG: UDP-N-acetylmuramoyl-tripeptide--D-alanyl-D-alanine ligase [Lentisphaerae bacterium]|nr:UDP-N-acetylmuramoyl-tripeptide--D-alanyl-D-alanine ligase [Lentisphaerota bacterium]
MNRPDQLIGAPQPALDAGDLAQWSGGTWDPVPPPMIIGVSNDSRSLGVGALYVALSGERFDGHAFVRAAADRGAVGAVVRRDWPREVAPGFPLLRVADTTRALQQMAGAHRLQVAPRCIGITGSAGKTTVKELTAGAVSACFPTARSLGNWNNGIGLPLSLLSMGPSTKVGVFEVGTNHPGEIRDLCAVLRPDWGMITNIGPGHIEFFQTERAIAEEKADLLRALPRDGVSFLNRDGAWFDLLAGASVAPVVTVSTRGPADYVLRQRTATNDQVIAQETASGETFQFRLNTGGEFQVANALMAIAVARRLGVSRAGIEASLSGDSTLPMRWQRTSVLGVHVINDAYNANPLSMRAALEAFRDEPLAGRKWLVLGAMLELGEQAEPEHRSLGRAVAQGPWAGVIAVGAGAGWLAQGAVEAGFAPDKVYPCERVEEAARLIVEHVVAGDGVLLKASRGAHVEHVLRHWDNMCGAGRGSGA